MDHKNDEFDQPFTEKLKMCERGIFPQENKYLDHKNMLGKPIVRRKVKNRICMLTINERGTSLKLICL